MSDKKNLIRAYKSCQQLLASELPFFADFSHLAPKTARLGLTAVGAFILSAWQIAQNGQDLEARLQKLDVLTTQLKRSSRGEPTEAPILIALGATIRQHALPIDYFLSIINGLKQHISTLDYADFDALNAQCQLFANPIGRIILHLCQAANAQNMQDADAICTALWLFYGYQRFGELTRNKIIPIAQCELHDYQVQNEHLYAQKHPPLLRALLHFQYFRAQQILERGAELATRATPAKALFAALFKAGNSSYQQLLASPDAYTATPLSAKNWQQILKKSWF